MDIGTAEGSGPAPAQPRDTPHAFHARLARVKGRSLLFSASQKAIYGLNDSAADIWRWSAEGTSVAEAGRRLAERGIGQHLAESHVRGALASWERLGLIVPRRDALCPPDGLVSRTLTLAGVRVRLSLPAGQAGPVMASLRHLETPGAAADVHFELLGNGPRRQLFRNGAWLAACLPGEVAPLLRARLLAEVLDRGGYELALHVAALAVGDRVLLLCGPPGAGKTTLSLGLARAGFGYCADDVTLLDASAMCTGVPLAPAVKRGAWSVLQPSCPGLARAPVHRRPDGRQVRYPTPERVERTRPLRAAWIVMLDRSPGERTRLAAVDPVEALQGLLADAFAREGQLTDRAFDALAGAADRAEIRRLVYSELGDAVDALRDWCR